MGKKKSKTQYTKKPAARYYQLLIYPFLVMLFAAAFYQRALCGDVWWHLKTGQWILNHHAIPYTDPFSYTATHPFIVHEWGAEVIMWLLYSLSPSTLALAFLLLTCSTFVIAYRVAYARTSDTLASFIAVGVGAVASIFVSEIRPHVFTIFLFAISIVIFERYQRQRSWHIWLLPILILIWANLHGGVVLGTALIAFEAVISLLSPPEWSLGHRRSRLYAAVPLFGILICSALLALVNPNGTWVYRYTIEAMSQPYMNYIIEWTSPSFHNAQGRALIVFIGLAVVGLTVRGKRPAFRDFAYFSCFTIASLISRRYIPMLAVACAAPVALWISDSFKHTESIYLSNRKATLIRSMAWVIIVITIISFATWRVLHSKGKSMFDYMTTSEWCPSGACDFILANNISGPMINDVNYGGYLIFRLWPKHKVFADTRIHPFLDGAWEDAATAIHCTRPVSWYPVFVKYKPNVVILNYQSTLASVLLERREWILVYFDHESLVFVRNIEDNKEAIMNRRHP